MSRTLILVLLITGSALSQQQLKLAQADHTTSLHRLTFTLVHRAILPSTVTAKAGVYQIRFRNGETAKDVTFDVMQQTKAADPSDSTKIANGRSAAAYGFYRFTPGTYKVTVREYPQYLATLEIVP